MKALLPLICVMCFVSLSACKDVSLSSLNTGQINALLAEIDENDPKFTLKEIQFDSIVTMAGWRTLGEQKERIKLKLFYFGVLSRGYYNLSDKSPANLQVFGKLIENNWVLKCVTKIDMEEVGGYLIIKDQSEGIWSTGDVNFKMGLLELSKKYTDYNDLETW